MKVLKIIFIVLVLLFTAILAVPVLFKGELMELAKQEVNKNVKAEVDWSDFKVSLFRGFPDLKVSLVEMSVLGTENFDGDTLVAFENFSVKIDLISALSGEISVKSIILDKPVVNAISLSDGSVNWDITYPSEEMEEEEADTSSSASNFAIDLREFRINDASISYYDEAGKMFAGISGYNLELSGNFSQVFTDLDLYTYAESLTVDMGGMKYLNNVFFSLKALLGADLENMKFEIRENLLKINDIALGLEGVIGLPEGADAEVDVNFFTKETAFKSLLSMVPAIYTKDFEELETSGKLEIEGTAVGLVKDDILPKIGMNLKVSDARFAYPDLPKAVEDISIDLGVYYDGANEENTSIDLNNFHLEMAGNPVDIKFHAHDLSDLKMNGSILANMDLSSLQDAIPIEDMALQGMLNANIELMGKLSDIENENYEEFMADGLLEISDLTVEGEALPVPVNIEKTSLFFSPRYVDLRTLDVKMGESDIHLDGKLENFIPYVFEGGTIQGELNFSSDYLNITELIPESEEVAMEEVEDTTQIAVIEIPGDVDFKLQTSLKKVLYDQLELENILGILWVKDSKVNLDRLAMELLGGSMEVNGKYDTSDPTTPIAELGLDIEDIDIQASASAFNTVEKLAPIADKCRGKVSVQFDFVSFLDEQVSPVLNTMVGRGRLKTDEVKIEDNETFTKIGKLLKKEDLADQKFKDLDVSFEIREGRAYVKPFDTRLGNSKLNVSGSQGLDQTLDYILAFEIPRGEFGNAANDMLEDLASKAASKGLDFDAGETVNVNVKIKGDFSDPEIGLDVRENLSNTKSQVKEAVEEKIKEEVEEVKTEIREDVSEEVDRIMKEAEEEAEKLRKAAADAGEALIGEAKLRKKQLVKEAGSNPVKKIAAEKAGDSLIKAAITEAESLEKVADEKAEKILDAAQQKADAIKNK